MFVWEKSSTFAVPNKIRIMLFASQLHDFKMLLPWVRIRHEQLALRAVIEQQRRVMTPEQVAEQSALIIARLEQMSSFQAAKTVLLYYPIQNEVDVLPLVKKYKHEKTLLFPVSHRHGMTVHPYAGNKNMHRGKFGIPEPTTPAYEGGIDLVIVPAVAFDAKGRRLGRGGGYYDRFIKKLTHAVLVGVGYDFQLVEQVPTSQHDQCVHRIILPSQTIVI